MARAATGLPLELADLQRLPEPARGDASQIKRHEPLRGEVRHVLEGAAPSREHRIEERAAEGDPAEHPPGAVVELGRDRVEMVLGEPAQVSVFVQILAQQPAGVLVGAALPLTALR